MRETNMNRLLLVEDDQNLGYILKEYLELNKFKVIWAKNGLEGLEYVKKSVFDLCILDIMMPEMDGFTLARSFKKQKIDTPFIFLTAKTLKIDKLKGFNLGADDYIVKPIDEEILIARIEAILKRSGKNERDHSGNTDKQTFKIGEYIFDHSKQQLILEDAVQQLTSKENELLVLLCNSNGNLLSREKALKHIWGEVDYFNRRTMDVYISKLRKYLKQDPAVVIKNVHGKGFILEI